MDFFKHSFVDLALILLVAFVLMLPRPIDSHEDIVIPKHSSGMCKCGPRYDLTLNDDEIVTFARTNQQFSVSDMGAITDHLYGPFMNFSPKYSVITVRANKNVSFNTLFMLTEHLKNSGAEFVAWSRL
jgi:biopolymer transport protein ExbD